MAVKNTTQVLIGGKIITLSGYESEEYLQKVANYMNGKLTELGQLPGYNRQSQETRHTLLSLNIADDYFKAKRQAEMFEEELEAKDREMYDLKHDLINKQVELDEAKEKGRAALYRVTEFVGIKKRLLNVRTAVKDMIVSTDRDIARTALLAKGLREAGQTINNAFHTFADKPEVDYSQKEQKHPFTKAVLAPMKAVKKLLVSNGAAAGCLD